MHSLEVSVDLKLEAFELAEALATTVFGSQALWVSPVRCEGKDHLNEEGL